MRDPDVVYTCIPAIIIVRASKKNLTRPCNVRVLRVFEGVFFPLVYHRKYVPIIRIITILRTAAANTEVTGNGSAAHNARYIIILNQASSCRIIGVKLFTNYSRNRNKLTAWYNYIALFTCFNSFKWKLYESYYYIVYSHCLLTFTYRLRERTS